jgi:nicotinamide mononucleotide transporter
LSVFHELYAAQLVIAGHPITYREIAGNVFGLASAVGGLRRRVWAWPVGLAGNVLLLTVFAGAAFGAGDGVPLFGQAGRQVFFIAVSVYGWERWRQTARAGGDRVAKGASGARPGGDRVAKGASGVRSGGDRVAERAPAVQPRPATARERRTYLLLAAGSLVVCVMVFRASGAGFPAPWWYYVCDSWIFVGSVLATVSMARGWVDFWLMWIAVDAVGVPELLHFHYYPSAALYAIYAGFVCYGFIGWRRIARQPLPTDPRMCHQWGPDPTDGTSVGLSAH